MRLASAVLLAVAAFGAEMPLVEQEGRFNDEPTMARASDGSVYVAWNGFRDGADALSIARYRFDGGQLRHLATWAAPGGVGAAILNPKIVAAGGGTYLVYAAERGRQWDIYALPCGEKGPGRPIAITSDAAIDIKPDAVWSKGVLWVAWESNRDRARRVMLASERDGKVSSPEVVSQYGGSDYGPSIAADSSGAVSIAWHGFRSHNYDVFLRRRAATGGWSPEQRLTTAPTMDRHPLLLNHKDETWVLYENAHTQGYRTGNAGRRRVFVAKITPRGLLAPKGQRESSPLALIEKPNSASPAPGRGAESIAPAFDGSGRLWAAYLRPRLPRGGWEVWFTGYNGQSWEQPRALTKWKGMDRRPAILVEGDTAVLAFQTDDFPETWVHNLEATPRSKSRVVLVTEDLRNAAPAAPSMALEPLVEPDDPYEAGQLRVSYGEDAEAPAIDYQGKKLHILFGDLHTHSDISVCNRCGDQSVDENYQVRRDINRLDFACVTDHDYNFVPYLWNYTAKMARVNEDPERLTTFLAMEWTSSFEKYPEETPFGYYGHRNLILADPFFPKWWNADSGQTPAELWAELRKMGANFVQIPHQIADTGNVPTDWRYADEKAQPVAEIFQNRGSYEHLNPPRGAPRAIPKSGWYLQDVWARGTVVGVIASPDHGGGRGKAAVFSPDYSRESILEAIRERHTYGTTAARIFLEVRVNGRLMGEKIPASGGKPVEVKIRVRCPGDIDRVEVCRNNQFIYVNQPESRSADLTFIDNAPIDGYSYYYVRVMQKDEEIAWSSPVWLGAK
jgi:hypothetical protein